MASSEDGFSTSYVDNRRARELHRYLIPSELERDPEADGEEYGENLIADPALTSFARLVCIALRAERATIR